MPVTHGIFLNLAEGALRSFENMPVSAGEGQKIFTDTGWAVGTNDRQEHEFELLWFLNREWSELRLTFAASDFEGRVLTPSRLWMWAAFNNDQLRDEAQAPRPTRWDQIQHGPLEALGRVRELDSARLGDLEWGARPWTSTRRGRRGHPIRGCASRRRRSKNTGSVPSSSRPTAS